MTRRVALALALALTTVVTFALVVIGTQAGLFGSKSGGDTTSALAQEPSAAATASAPADTQAPTQAPGVTEYLTEYRYYDAGSTQQAPAPTADGQLEPAAPQAGEQQPTPAAQETLEPRETPEPDETPKPDETPEPRPTPEPKETPKPGDDD